MTTRDDTVCPLCSKHAARVFSDRQDFLEHMVSCGQHDSTSAQTTAPQDVKTFVTSSFHSAEHGAAKATVLPGRPHIPNSRESEHVNGTLAGFLHIVKLFLSLTSTPAHGESFTRFQPRSTHYQKVTAWFDGALETDDTVAAILIQLRWLVTCTLSRSCTVELSHDTHLTFNVFLV